ncbi:YczI family protein [Terribacillus saccharophilus]|uniref:DUF3953 domain-containing protein n=1 Tax=Terribacillus saccharophilus TaxID=361277 RepID=A0ABX4GZ19_9BACI|nr:YczI family protein [Terribacillus saccharophilus]PAD35491.1 hypothetical protein CHH56_08490 [Terribacillus saccharophilus]PAD96548.1 hypothetical protein CHH50_08070 [Terribacillus saccharophilus]PAE00124.1 hypothetical protein CHH48_08975 [Terribacillus saccharophilus]
MLTVLRIILAIIVVTFGIYGLVTGNHELSPYMFFFLGLMFMVIGFSEFKVKRQGNAVICIIASIFVLFVAVFTG